MSNIRQRHFSDARDAAFKRVARWTQSVEALPGEDALFSHCFNEVMKCKQPLSLLEKKKIAGQIAASIRKNFDPAKRRPPPKTSRTDRYARDLELLRSHLARSEGESAPSYRALALRYEMSPNSVKRIVRSHLGPTDAQWRRSGALTDEARITVRYLDSHLPVEGLHFVHHDDLEKAVLTAMGLDLYEAHRDAKLDIDGIAKEIAEHQLGLQLIAVATGILISRGRKITERQAREWLGKRRHISQKQLPKYALSKRNLVFSDLAMVVRTTFEHVHALDIGEFVRISLFPVAAVNDHILDNMIGTDSTFYNLERLKVHDVEGVERSIRLAQNALYRQGDGGAFEWAATHNPRDADAILAIRLLLQTLDARENPHAAVLDWIDETSYVEKIWFDILPGRKVSDVTVFLAHLDAFTEAYGAGSISDREILGQLARMSYDAD
ncbi:hypothetical protein OF122_07285 [Pelagibacterium flavum]|uniref:Uncharacterized protein n=1 Tax=Pelagibacterium flavum TaxID=2984530 RepID=A0ABY6ISF9_9HYPH|nr:hypothetical protein [Pelagibacterium sp. YIM 151497]UYQ73549.1 hypothetical protein OF122_07285 [Pelagibacterium sp. YIM 151497]